MAGVLLALVTWGAWSRYATWVEVRKIRSRLDTVATEQRGIRQQLSNLLSMLLRAGFKRGTLNPDWSDNEQATRLIEDSDTKWYWRKK